MRTLPVTLAFCVTLGALVASAPAYASSTIVIGKAVSETGSIIIGHNEDNPQRTITAQYWVPAAEHATDEIISFEPGAAKIPQVPHTHGFYWAQILHPQGYSYSDNFLNERGVYVSSSQAVVSSESKERLVDGGVGYAVRRLIAERANSARDGVKIAIDLVTRYGYRDIGRIYTIADKDEVWQLNLLHGSRYIARRIKDNEVVFINNAFSLRDVNLKSPDIIASPDLIKHATARHRYDPAKVGDTSDFNFHTAYQLKENPAADACSQRALELITGSEIRDSKDFPFSVTPKKKMGVADVKRILRSHSRYEDRSRIYHKSANDICGIGTSESFIFVFEDNPLLIQGYRSPGRPCETAYIPFYPIAKPSPAEAFLTAEEALSQQFNGKASSFDYRKNFDFYSFLVVQNYTELLGSQETASKVFLKLEKDWNSQIATMHKRAKTYLKEFSSEKSMRVLHGFNLTTFDDAVAAARGYIAGLPTVTVDVGAHQLSKSEIGTIKVTTYSSREIPMSHVDWKTAYFGLLYPYSDGTYIKPAKAQSATAYDVNGDGLKDVTFIFDKPTFLKKATAGVLQDIWFAAFVDGKKVAGFDLVRIEK